MADLGQVLGELLKSLAQARRIADEQTVALAEHYRSTPLLDGLSLPRIRLPEVVIDIPVVIDDVQSGDEEESPKPDPKRLSKMLMDSSGEAGVSLPKLFIGRFEREVRRRIAQHGKGEDRGRMSGEALSRISQGAFADAIAAETIDRFDDAQTRRVLQDLADRVRSLVPPRKDARSAIVVSVLTEEIKERADPESVTRLKLTLREEGLEWTSVDHPDGDRTMKLVPE